MQVLFAFSGRQAKKRRSYFFGKIVLFSQNPLKIANEACIILKNTASEEGADSEHEKIQPARERM